MMLYGAQSIVPANVQRLLGGVATLVGDAKPPSHGPQPIARNLFISMPTFVRTTAAALINSAVCSSEGMSLSPIACNAICVFRLFMVGSSCLR